MMPPTVHATVLVIGTIGLLLRGRSGAGKSALADDLIARARSIGRFAALVADDRVVLAVSGGRVIGRPPTTLQGLIERRGLGVMPVDHEPAVIVRAVVDLIETTPERVPVPGHAVEIAGIRLPCLEIQRHDPTATRLIEAFLAACAVTA